MEIKVFSENSDKNTMMNFFCLLMLLISNPSFAKDDWKSKVKSLLPKPLDSFEFQKTNRKEVEKKLGKAHLIEGKDHYYEKDDFKYALKLTYDDQDKLTNLHYTFTGDKPKIEQLKGTIPLDKFSIYPAEGKSAGKFLIFRDKKSELIIDPVTKTIHTVALP